MIIAGVNPAEQREALRRVDFDCPFRVTESGTVDTSTIVNVYAPNVMHDDDTDVVIEANVWSAFSVGYTGQHGYRGAVMHASEYLGGRLADDILAEAGVYVVTSVEAPSDDDESTEPVGWIVLRLTD